MAKEKGGIVEFKGLSEVSVRNDGRARGSGSKGLASQEGMEDGKEILEQWGRKGETGWVGGYTWA